jgi:hypothetical protein
VIDLDGDGLLEIIVPTASGIIYVIDSRGTPSFQFIMGALSRELYS